MCDYIVDQNVPDQLEPDYTTLGFEAIFCRPFLNPQKSPQLTRAFYIPLLSDSRNHFNDYCLLRHKRREE